MTEAETGKTMECNTSDVQKTDLCIVCKRYAFHLCTTCEVLGLKDSCWVDWDATKGLRHWHCEFGTPTIKKSI